MAVIKYENIKLRNTTKTGKLKPDENGYYDVILGAMNAFNSRNEYYAMEGAEKIFTGSSIYHNRLTSGKLYGEHGHPKPDGMSREEYFRRLLEIREDKWGTFFKSVTLDDTLWKRYPGMVTKGAIIIMGKVMPFGRYKDTVADGLANPDINFAYSVRSFTRNFQQANVTTKVMTELVTWDSVGSQGIPIAEKYNAPGLESDEEEVSLELLSAANKRIYTEHPGGRGLESGAETYDRLILHADSNEELADVLKSNKIWTNWK